MLWLRLGIRHERIEPGKPQQNGRHERMHQTLKQETANPPERNLPPAANGVPALFNRSITRSGRTKLWTMQRPHRATRVQSGAILKDFLSWNIPRGRTCAECRITEM